MLASITAFVVAFSVPSLAPSAAVAPVSRAAVRLFDLSPENNPKAPEVEITTVTRSRQVGAGRTGSIVVTDGSGSFYSSRTIFQMLFDFGGYASITASSASTADAKKSLITRAGRYSGLSDVLGYHEGEVGTAFEGGETWLAMSPDEAALPAQIEAAKSAGVSKVFLLLSEALSDAEAIDAKLAASGLDYTVMRTGPLVDGPAGVGLKLGEVDMPVCDEVPKDDVFRFVTEALTLEESSKRAFSLCPSVATASTLKQMRLCGYERREEVQLLLAGVVNEQEAKAREEGTLAEPQTAEEAELVLRSEAEVAAEREEELKALLSKARQRGIETQERLAYEEKEKAARREEQQKYYSMPSDDSAPDTAPPPTDAGEAPETPPEESA